MGKFFSRFEKIISMILDLLLAVLIIIVLIVMVEAIYSMVISVIPLTSSNALSDLIEDIATLFILLEVILMLLRYVKDGHHIPVRYLILISITAILRELLLAHGSGSETLFLSIAIMVLVFVLYVLERVKSFHNPDDHLHQE